MSISEQDEHLAEAGVVAEHGDYVAVDHTTEPDPPPPVGQEPAEPQLAFPDAATWVREWLRHNYKRRISKGSGNVWAADWWRYPEAVSRIESLWRAWEHLRLDPATGMSVWFRDHADHHMRVLMDPDWGPFGKHGATTNDVTDPLPHEDPPEGFFEPAGSAAEHA